MNFAFDPELLLMNIPTRYKPINNKGSISKRLPGDDEHNETLCRAGERLRPVWRPAVILTHIWPEPAHCTAISRASSLCFSASRVKAAQARCFHNCLRVSDSTIRLVYLIPLCSTGNDVSSGRIIADERMIDSRGQRPVLASSLRRNLDGRFGSL